VRAETLDPVPKLDLCPELDLYPEQVMRCADAGAQLVRLTVQGQVCVCVCVCVHVYVSVCCVFVRCVYACECERGPWTRAVLDAHTLHTGSALASLVNTAETNTLNL
jgi:hypothetical protein